MSLQQGRKGMLLCLIEIMGIVGLLLSAASGPSRPHRGYRVATAGGAGRCYCRAVMDVRGMEPLWLWICMMAGNNKDSHVIRVMVVSFLNRFFRFTMSPSVSVGDFRR